MKYLDLSLNKLGDFGAVCLSKCIHKLKILNLSRCEITEVGVEALSKAVQKVSTPLHEMNLSENMFGDAGALLLSPCLLNLKRLDVSNCAIKEVGMGAISNTITNLSHPMEYLNASFNNELGDGGIAALSQCLHKLRKLHICHCNITSAGIKLLSEAMMIGSAQPMEVLRVDRNGFGNEGALALAHCLHKFKRIDVRYCSINVDGQVALSVAIRRLSQSERPVISGLYIQ
ncbi:ribonuclease inhibitor-like [Clavelina lepadiformis]